MDSKKRKANFCEAEKELLVQEYDKEFSTISSKFGPNVTTKKKHEAWLRVAASMNGRNPSLVRSCGKLQKKWQSMCSAMKDDFRTHRRESAKTGGGPPPKTPSPLSMKIASILGEDDPTFCGIQGGVDSLENVDMIAASESSSEPTDSSDANSSNISTTRIDAAASNPLPPPATLPRVLDSQIPRTSAISHLENIRTHKKDDVLKMQIELLALEKQWVTLEIEKLSMEKKKLAMEMEVLRVKMEKLGKQHVQMNYQSDSSNYSLFYL